MNYKVESIISILEAVSKQGIDINRLCDLSGLYIPELRNGKLPDMITVDRLWKNAVKLTGDKHLGLHIGEEGNLAALGIVGQIIKTSSNIREALNHICQFVNLLTNAFQIDLLIGKSEFQIIFDINSDCLADFEETVHQNIDTALVFAMKEYFSLTLGVALPVAVHYQKPKPEFVHEYQRVFKAPVYFSQNRTAITFSKNLLNKEIITADFECLNVMVSYANQMLKDQKNSQSFGAKVKETILKQSNWRTVKIADVAAIFNVSIRTFQRKLKEEEVTFIQIQDEVKQHLAKEYLKHDSAPIKEISYLLGYNGVSAFNRSFKRWTGLSPARFKRHLMLNIQ